LTRTTTRNAEDPALPTPSPERLELRVFMYHPHELGLPIVAVLRALLPATEERRLSDDEILVSGVMPHPHETARQAVRELSRSEPGWRRFVAIRFGDLPEP
jgi:hypothetical protein